MENPKNPLPEEMDSIDSNKSADMDKDDQLVDLENPMLHTFDNDDVIDNTAGFDNAEVGTDATQGLTPMHRQNVDEEQVTELLVEGNLDDENYPDIVDIADKDAAERTNDDDL